MIVLYSIVLSYFKFVVIATLRIVTEIYLFVGFIIHVKGTSAGTPVE